LQKLSGTCARERRELIVAERNGIVLSSVSSPK